MGILVEGRIPTFIGGISNQPDDIRFPNQVEDAENVVFAVEKGGFSKRPGTWDRVRIDETAADAYRLHVINRDSVEQYAVVFSQNGLRVFDATDWTERTVTIADAGDTTFFDKPPKNYEFLTALDFTFIVDKTQTVAMLPPSNTATETHASVQVTRQGLGGVHRITVSWSDGEFVGEYVAAASIEADDIATALHDDLVAKAPAGWSFVRQGSFIGIRNDSAVPFSVTTEDPHGDASLLTTVSRLTRQNDLVARTWNSHVVEIRDSADTEGYFLKFETDDGSDFGPGLWLESVPPDTETDFDPATMPRALVRQGDGSFELRRVDWTPKGAGGDLLVPKPEFVGDTISDMVFHRNRLGFVSRETVYFSRAGEYFNFWPDAASVVADDDPFGLSSTTNHASRFYYAVPFRRAIFIMADLAQFEVGGQVLTPAQASIELATSYSASGVCRPVAIGDELYFISDTDHSASLMSYVYDEDTVSESAFDVSKHVSGLLPTPISEMTADPIGLQIYMLAPDTPSKLYVHRFYYQENRRVQSAWTRFEFPDAVIHSAEYLRGRVVMVVERDGEARIEEFLTDEAPCECFSWVPRLDQRRKALGVYDPLTDETAVDCEVTPCGEPVVMTDLLFPEGLRMLSLTVTRVVGSTIYVAGRWDHSELLIGRNFPAHVELSKQFYREGEETIVGGRLQLRDITFRFANTGFFEVEIIPKFRETKTMSYTGRTIGSAKNLVQSFSTTDGLFTCGVRAKANDVRIIVRSNHFLPLTVTSAKWVGFFNEITRQDQV